MTAPGVCIGDIGEFALIERLRTCLGKAGATGGQILLSLGDDAACLRPESGRDQLLSTDIQVAGRHFLPEAMTAREIGARSVAVAVSDIFAMGGRPDALLLSLGLPKSFQVSWVEELYEGIGARCDAEGCRVIGGNLTQTDGPWFIDLTVVGSVPQNGAILRSTAKPGDVIWVSGLPGSSGVGLRCARRALEHGDEKNLVPGDSLPGESASKYPGIGSRSREIRDFATKNGWATPFLGAYIRPSSRGPLSAALRTSGVVSAMIDVSDGWLGDLRHLTGSSQCAAEVEFSAVPQGDSLSRACFELKISAEEALVSPSDDYELLWTAPVSASPTVVALCEACNTQGTPIGEIQDGPGEAKIRGLSQSNGGEVVAGWDHFRT